MCAEPLERMDNYGILCIIFDNEKGPVIKASDPPECLARSFQPLGQYFCPDQALAGRCVALTLEPYDVHGLPIYIPSETYDRSCFRFCIAVLVDMKKPARMLALQLAQVFYSLEVDRRFISQSDKQQLGRTLQQVRAGLNSRDQCISVPFSEVDAPLCFKERSTSKAPPNIASCDVPLPLCDLGQCQDPSWDMCLRQIIPFINGIYNVRSIATESGMAEDNVIIIIQHLMLFKLVTLIDMIQPSNYYRLTAKFKEIWTDPEVCATVGRYISGGHGEVDLSVAQQLYVELRSSDMLKEFMHKKKDAFDKYLISARHFVTFGLIHRFLRRLHVYPNVQNSTGPARSDPIAPYLGGEQPTGYHAPWYFTQNTLQRSMAMRVSALADGTRSMDAIQVELNLTYEEVNKALSDLPMLKFMVRR